MAVTKKQLHELINREDPGWPVVQGWIAEAKNLVEVLPPVGDATREKALVSIQVTTRSPMGAIIYETGGILVDHGWLRILGSGHPRLPRSLPDWNFGRSVFESGERPSSVLCADDAIGGFFAIDGGGFGIQQGMVCYFAPDRLVWENTKLSYSQFLVWSFQGDLAKYYESERWPGWQQEVSNLGGDQVFGIYPFLFCDDKPITERLRKPVSISEVYDLQIGQRDER
ncbi:MAG: DUF2625 domain-containing protein [Verrucomicrobia bacterium]|nr:MAG: DUF2625 domain-containing protein [Verrucomicrobiota bacterium]